MKKITKDPYVGKLIYVRGAPARRVRLAPAFTLLAGLNWPDLDILRDCGGWALKMTVAEYETPQRVAVVTLDKSMYRSGAQSRKAIHV